LSLGVLFGTFSPQRPRIFLQAKGWKSIIPIRGCGARGGAVLKLLWLG